MATSKKVTTDDKPPMEHRQSNTDDFKTVAIDLDGVLAQYTGWKNSAGKIGQPYRHAWLLLQELHQAYRVIIWSSRSSALILSWLVEHDLWQFVDEINVNTQIYGDNPGKPVASAYVDDRAIRFEGDVPRLLTELAESIEWWKRGGFVPGNVVR
jgi:hypothetical protein